MLKRHNLKYEKSNVLQLIIIITSGFVVLFSLMDVIRYYTQDNFLTLSSPIAAFLSYLVLAMVSVVIALKGKSFLGGLILLALAVLNNGIFFLRQLLSGNLDFKSFAGFESLTYFVLAVLLVVFLILEIKKGNKPVLQTLKKPQQLILVLISLGFFLFFNQVMFTVFFSSILLVLILFDEETFIPHIIAFFSTIYFFSFIDYFIRLNNNPNYEMPVYNWLETLLGIGLITIAIISIIKPNFLTNNPKQLSMSDNQEEETI